MFIPELGKVQLLPIPRVLAHMLPPPRRLLQPHVEVVPTPLITVYVIILLWFQLHLLFSNIILFTYLSMYLIFKFYLLVICLSQLEGKLK